MTLIGTTPLTRYPRLHPDMGYLRTIMSPAMNPMTLNDLPICQFPSCLMAGHDKQFIFVRRGKFCLTWPANYRLRSALAALSRVPGVP